MQNGGRKTIIICDMQEKIVKKSGTTDLTHGNVWKVLLLY